MTLHLFIFIYSFFYLHHTFTDNPWSVCAKKKKNCMNENALFKGRKEASHFQKYLLIMNKLAIPELEL